MDGQLTIHNQQRYCETDNWATEHIMSISGKRKNKDAKLDSSILTKAAQNFTSKSNDSVERT